MRFLIRQATLKDQKALLRLAEFFPLSSLPPNPVVLKKKLKTSQQSFNKSLNKHNRNYIFVMEDCKTKQLIASSQILSYFGNNFCYFLQAKANNKVLKFKRITKGRHQNGGLILDPSYRKSTQKLGLQVSLARFLYIKTFPKEFSSLLEVSLTALIKSKKNHFWEQTGRGFLKKNYSKVLKNWSLKKENYLSLFPKNLQIPLSQLNKQAKDQLKSVDPQTYPVYKGLIKKGFKKTNRFHVLDGGIYLEAKWKNLAFLKKTKGLVLKKERDVKSLSQFFISQQTAKGFFCSLILGQVEGKHLCCKKLPPEFEKDKKALALPFTC